MDNTFGLFDIGYCKLKTARQKKRLQIKDADKQLRKLDRLYKKLYQAKRHLPLTPLATPYQKGWVRTFGLRDDIARSSSALFFQTLLEKINTKDFCNEKSFLVKKKGKRKKGYEPKEQWLKTFSETAWISPKLELTELEKQYFLPQEYPDTYGKGVTIRYTFTEPWKHVLQTKPHIITHIRLLDEALEQQLQEIDNRMEIHHLWPRIKTIIRGRSYNPWRHTDKEKYKSQLKNKPLHCILQKAENDLL